MNHYLLAAYVIGSLLLWGYAISLWAEVRSMARRNGSGKGGRS